MFGGGQDGQSGPLSCSGPRSIVIPYKFGPGLVVYAMASMASTVASTPPLCTSPDPKLIVRGLITRGPWDREATFRLTTISIHSVNRECPRFLYLYLAVESNCVQN